MISHPLGREFVSRLRAVDDTVVPHELPERDALERLVQVGGKNLRSRASVYVCQDAAGGRGDLSMFPAALRFVVLLLALFFTVVSCLLPCVCDFAIGAGFVYCVVGGFPS